MAGTIPMHVECAHTMMMSVQSLIEKRNGANPNEHNEEGGRVLAKIMAFQGVRNPIVVSARSGKIIKGHGRLEAAIINGWTQFPVDVQKYKSYAQEYADMRADNEVAKLAKLNKDIASNDVRKLLKALPHFDLEYLGDPKFKLKPIEFEVTKPEKKPKGVITHTCPECGHKF